MPSLRGMAFTTSHDAGSASQRFVCLLYHDVYPTEGSDYGRLGRSAVMYHVSEAAFRQHLLLIGGTGERPMDMDAVRRSVAARPSPTAGGRSGTVVCFDDGWAGAVTRGAAVLRELAMPALFFVTTRFVGRKYFAARGDLRQLEPDLFTIGSHGASHRMLSSLPTAAIREDLSESKSWLEDLLGRSVTALSIPGGAVDRRVVAVARELGYTEIFTSAIAVNPTTSGPWGIARIGVTQTTTTETVARWLALQVERERWRKAMLALPKTMLGMRNYSRLRRTFLGDGDGYEPLFQP